MVFVSIDFFRQIKNSVTFGPTYIIFCCTLNQHLKKYKIIQTILYKKIRIVLYNYLVYFVKTIKINTIQNFLFQ